MRFIVIASRRTGSSHLVNTLSGHPDIFCHGNVLDKRMMAVFWPKGKHPKPTAAQKIKRELRDFRDRDVTGFIEKVFCTSHGKPSVGFKVFQGENDNLLNIFLADDAVGKIILYRKNVLAVYSSARVARQTGKWGVIRGSQPPTTTKVVFDEKEFSSFYARYTRFYTRTIKRLNESQQKFIFLNYEDVNDPYVLSSAITFIGADPNKSILEETQRKQQVKLNSSDILSRFSNPDDVERFMQRKGLCHWSREGEAPIGLA